jgi:plasmid stabilization system protein ParE
MNPAPVWNKTARQEMEAAFIWYEQQVLGLGWQFADEVEAAIAAIHAQPNAFPIIHAKLRKFVLRRFPYAVIYQAEGSRIVVHAVFHAKRNPQQWRERGSL